MASYTPNLNLLKKSPVTDGEDTFNVDTMLNENWDKIDEYLGKISKKTDEMYPSVKNKTVSIVQGSFNLNLSQNDEEVKTISLGFTPLIVILVASASYATGIPSKGSVSSTAVPRIITTNNGSGSSGSIISNGFTAKFVTGPNSGADYPVYYFALKQGV